MKTRVIFAVVAALLCLPALSQNTGSFTLSTQANSDSTLTPTLTWQTTPEATSCTASGDAAWEGTKAGSGSETLAPFPTTSPKAYALLCQWPGDAQALITWTAPTENTDGTALTNLAGYRVHWGQAATELIHTMQLDNPGLLAYTVEGLTPGTWFFAVRAFTTQGAESALSNIVSKTTSEGVEWSQQTGVKVPKAPGMGDVQ